MTPAPQAGRVETLNETPLYFEVHGTGEPVMLLHGFSGSSRTGPLPSKHFARDSNSWCLTFAVTADRAP
jgi:pimeloyl-ACP methyl ester carboxylesterase